MSGGRWLALGFLLLTAAKIATAARLDLFGDEAFYFLCSQRLDVAFSDHPFMTALLVRGGAELLPGSTLGVRLMFLALGALFPLLVHRLALPLVGAAGARAAAGFALLAPATAWLGVLALPDVPQMTFAALALLAFERATRTRALGAWLAAGIACALGLATHYRFALVVLALFLYLVATRRGRAQWRTAGPFVALPLVLLGLLPVLLFNLRLDFAPLKFQGVERHQGGFDFEALLLHLPLQAAAVTPLLYAALLGAGWSLLRRARAGDDRAQLLALFAAVHLGTYFATSPFADSDHATIHWPAPGYIPLLVALPAWLAEFAARRATPARRALAARLPGAVAGVALGLVLLETATGLFGFQPLRRPFAGWEEMGRAAAEHLAVLPRAAGARPIAIGDNYIVAGNLQFELGAAGLGADVYALRHPKNAEHGRQLQFDLWRRGEAGLAERAGEDALVVVERNAVRSRAWDAWQEHLAGLFERLEPAGELEVPTGARGKSRQFLFYVGRGIRPRP